MQPSLFEPQTLPALPQQGFVDQWIFESPLPIALSFVAIGIVIWGVVRNTKHRNRIGIPSLITGFILGTVIYATGTLITTDIEVLKDKSKLLVVAASQGDRPNLETLLDQRVQLKASFVSQSGKDNVIALSVSRAAPIISSAYAKEINAGIYGPQVARTQIKVKVDADMIPPSSWWAIDWTRPSPESDQWVVTNIEPIWIQGFSNPTANN